MNTTANANAMNDTATDDSILAGLLDQLGDDDAVLETLELDGADAGEADDSGIVEPMVADAAGDDDLLESIAADAAGDDVDSLLDAVAADAAKHDVYNEQTATGEMGGAPETDAEALTQPEVAATPKKKGGSKKKDAAPAATGEEKEAAPPKAPRATSVTHKPGDLLLAKLGEKAESYLVLNMADAELAPEEQAAKRAAFVARMNDKDAIADKVKEKAIMLFVWLTNGGKLNTVMERSFRLLAEEGVLTSGDKGNLQLNLLAKPLSIGTSRSQSNQIFMLFPELKLTIKEKGKMVANPDSALLPMIMLNLGL